MKWLLLIAITTAGLAGACGTNTLGTGTPSQKPSTALSVPPTRAVPEIAGFALKLGGAATGAVVPEGVEVWPTSFVPVTRTRSVWPTSALMIQ